MFVADICPAWLHCFRSIHYCVSWFVCIKIKYNYLQFEQRRAKRGAERWLFWRPDANETLSVYPYHLGPVWSRSSRNLPSKHVLIFSRPRRTLFLKHWNHRTLRVLENKICPKVWFEAFWSLHTPMVIFQLPVLWGSKKSPQPMVIFKLPVLSWGGGQKRPIIHLWWFSNYRCCSEGSKRLQNALLSTFGIPLDQKIAAGSRL